MSGDEESAKVGKVDEQRRRKCESKVVRTAFRGKKSFFLICRFVLTLQLEHLSTTFWLECTERLHRSVPIMSIHRIHLHLTRKEYL